VVEAVAYTVVRYPGLLVPGEAGEALMAVSQGKMLGRYCRGPGGYKCSCCQDYDTVRWRRQIERRELARDLAPVADREWLASINPLMDLSDCPHGCNGSPSCGSERCTFICHGEQ
jgi:hypothetical protein